MSAEKLPVLPLFSDDFIAGTVGFSAAEAGAFMRLLCYQWGKGSVPVDDDARLRRITGLSGDELDDFRDIIRDKFPDGVNPRLASEREKALDGRAKAKHRGKQAAQKRWDAPSNAPTMPQACSKHAPSNATSTEQAMLEECPPSPTPTRSTLSPPGGDEAPGEGGLEDQRPPWLEPFCADLARAYDRTTLNPYDQLAVWGAASGWPNREADCRQILAWLKAKPDYAPKSLRSCVERIDEVRDWAIGGKLNGPAPKGADPTTKLGF